MGNKSRKFFLRSGRVVRKKTATVFAGNKNSRESRLSWCVIMKYNYDLGGYCIGNALAEESAGENDFCRHAGCKASKAIRSACQKAVSGLWFPVDLPPETAGPKLAKSARAKGCQKSFYFFLHFLFHEVTDCPFLGGLQEPVLLCFLKASSTGISYHYCLN